MIHFFNSLEIFGAEKLFVLAPLIALWVFYKSDKETRKHMLIFAFFSLPLTFILGEIARKLYFDPRPFVVGGYNPLISHAPDNGFPSDHTLLLAAISSTISLFDKRFALALWIITILVALSRIYVGVHHFVDVLASISIAVLASLVVYGVLRWRKSAEPNNIEV